VPGSVFEGIKNAIVADRYAYFDDFFANFYNTDVLAPERIGDAAVRGSSTSRPPPVRSRATPAWIRG